MTAPGNILVGTTPTLWKGGWCDIFPGDHTGGNLQKSLDGTNWFTQFDVYGSPAIIGPGLCPTVHPATGVWLRVDAGTGTAEMARGSAGVFNKQRAAV